ncbi:secretory protein [Chitinophaga oryziterrae]|uniref:Secretory protein n=1 Tax=Chitinophaga oryziterrae TaxID=1031224 RepID=A0A6N8JFM3_9BACT|nr:basic secretory protein-like protein [Chitinophaga oryziterrae]MVT44020.1 secretory protein [Chitinophaga oryziterrae]
MVLTNQGLKRMMASLCLSVCLLPAITKAQQKDSITKGGFTLIYENKSATFDTAVGRRLINTFFEVYPKQVARFNKNAVKVVYFEIDPTYDGIAATYGTRIRFNPEWFKKNPNDIDVVTHEGMHVVQSYPGYDPGWLTEGIADYVRFVYGVDNPGAHWTLPDFKAGQSYKQAYRVTARFLVWVEKNKRKDLVNKLDAAMRTKTYTPAIWKDLTGESVDELWTEYAANPVI